MISNKERVRLQVVQQRQTELQLCCNRLSYSSTVVSFFVQIQILKLIQIKIQTLTQIQLLAELCFVLCALWALRSCKGDLEMKFPISTGM